MNNSCGGCVKTGGRPFGGDCVIAVCCGGKGDSGCGGTPFGGGCAMKKKVIDEFNALGIPDMPEITDLNALVGGYINLEYTLPGAQKVKFWDDRRVYLGTQVQKTGSDRCYGLTADENHLLVCEYGENGADAEIIIYKKR